jgi:hypothetical protein
LKFGFKASAEQFAPRELLEYSVLAEEVGFESVWISDHFQPWRHTGGHAPFSLAWLGALGARTHRVGVDTETLLPNLAAGLEASGKILKGQISLVGVDASLHGFIRHGQNPARNAELRAQMLGYLAQGRAGLQAAGACNMQCSVGVPQLEPGLLAEDAKVCMRVQVSSRRPQPCAGSARSARV